MDEQLEQTLAEADRLAEQRPVSPFTVEEDRFRWEFLSKRRRDREGPRTVSEGFPFNG